MFDRFVLFVEDKVGQAWSWFKNRWGRFSKPPTRQIESDLPSIERNSQPTVNNNLPGINIQISTPENGTQAENSRSGQNLDSPPGLGQVTADNNAGDHLSHERIVTPSELVNEKAPIIINQVPIEIQAQDNESTSGVLKMVHVQISADIPEETTVNLILEVARGQARSTISKTLSSREVAQDMVAAPLHQGGDDLQALQIPGQIRPDQRSISKLQNTPVRTIWFKRVSARIRQFLFAIRQAVGSLIIKFNRLKDHEKFFLMAAVAIYALVVSIGIDRFPIYFFTDEAIHMNMASDFIQNGLKNYYGEFLPTFFSEEGWVNGTSVYVQVVPYLIFGKSVVATRLVSAFITLLGALALGLLLKDVFKLKYYWVGILLLITTPAWFLHSRTAFEYVEVGSFFSIFLYFYGRYRIGHLRSLYWAIIAGALAFYTHGLGQILMGVTGLALIIIDFRYHIHPDRRKTILKGILLIVILFLPFVRYYVAHPSETINQLKRRDSYWIDGNLSFSQKLGQFFSQYLYGLSPNYWYFPNKVDISRHVMYGYGNGSWFTIPFLVAGLYESIRNIRLPAYRIVFVALLVCPIPASVVAIGMPRMVWMAIPLAILTAIGLLSILQWVETRLHISSVLLPAGLFIILAGLSVYMLRDALINGPIWFKDYSLYGMQYGAKQVFQESVLPGLEKDPKRRYVVSPNWANGSEKFIDFFIPQPLQSRVSMGQPIDVIDDIKKGTPDEYFVATSAEYDKLVVNDEFKNIKVYQMIPYPDSTPGFYVITLNVADNIDQIIAAQHEANVKPVEDTIEFNGQALGVTHSPLGSGRVEDIFDNNPDTLARVLEANPAIFDLNFATPIETNSIVIQTGSLPNFTLTISLYASGVTTPVTYTRTFPNNPPDPLVTMIFANGPQKSTRIHIEIEDNNSGESAAIEVRTIQIK